MIRKAPLSEFLSKNPFPNGWTDGLFYREKMRAIHRIAPSHIGVGRVLEIGGGRSGLGSYLFPGADITTLDLDYTLGRQLPANAKTMFVGGDACRLPFANATFDVVTLFDVLEHIPDHQLATAEALRVTRLGGYVLASTPDLGWRYPFYKFMQRVCPSEAELFEQWGHVRRGYSLEDLIALFGRAPVATAYFINPITAFYHDVSFSRLSRWRRKLLYALAGPVTLVGYLAHSRTMRGTEIALAWRR